MFFSEGQAVMINYLTQYLGLLGIVWKLSLTNKTKLKSTSVWDFPLPEASLQATGVLPLPSAAGISGLSSSHIEKRYLDYSLRSLFQPIVSGCYRRGEEGPC